MWTPKYTQNSLLPTGQFERMWFNHFWMLHAEQYPFAITECGYSVWPSATTFSAKNRPRWGIELVLSGNLVLIQNGRESLITPGQVMVLKYGEDQKYTTGPAGFCCKRWFVLGGTVVDHFLVDSGISQLDSFSLKSAERVRQVALLIKKMGTLIAGNPSEAAENLCKIASEICIELANSAHVTRYPHSLAGALAFIDKKIDGTTTLGEIARAGNISPQHLRRIFQKHLNDSPMNFFIKRKMVYARQLLTGTSLSIKEIADKTGYSDQFLFSKQFKRVAGISPRMHRKRAQGGGD